MSVMLYELSNAPVCQCCVYFLFGFDCSCSSVSLSVVRSGDYYLFETDSEEEEEEEEKKDEEPPKRSAFLVSEPLLVCRRKQIHLLWSQTYI